MLSLFKTQSSPLLLPFNPKISPTHSWNQKVYWRSKVITPQSQKFCGNFKLPTWQPCPEAAFEIHGSFQVLQAILIVIHQIFFAYAVAGLAWRSRKQLHPQNDRIIMWLRYTTRISHWKYACTTWKRKWVKRYFLKEMSQSNIYHN